MVWIRFEGELPGTPWRRCSDFVSSFSKEIAGFISLIVPAPHGEHRLEVYPGVRTTIMLDIDLPPDRMPELDEKLAELFKAFKGTVWRIGEIT